MKNKQGMGAKKFNKVLYIFLGIIVFITLLSSAYLAIVINNISLETSKNKYISIENNTKVETLAKLEDSLRDMSYEESRIAQYLPDDKEVSQILKDLEIMAGKNSLDFSIYKVGSVQSKNVAVPAKNKEKTDISQTEKSGDFYVFPFNITLTGSYSGVNAMIMEIEEYNRLVEVKEIKYSKEPTASGDVIDAVLQVNAYLKK